MQANVNDRSHHESAPQERRSARDKQPHAERRLQAYRRHSQQERESLSQLREFVSSGASSAWR